LNHAQTAIRLTFQKYKSYGVTIAPPVKVFPVALNSQVAKNNSINCGAVSHKYTYASIGIADGRVGKNDIDKITMAFSAYF
jgi:hypothetical protein